MKNWSKGVKRNVGFVVLAVFIIGYCLYVQNEWREFRTEKNATVTDLQSRAFALADHLHQFGNDWHTNNSSTGKGVTYYYDRFDDEFKPRLTEMVKQLGDRGQYSSVLEIGARNGQSQMTNAAEIRRMAKEVGK